MHYFYPNTLRLRDDKPTLFTTTTVMRNLPLKQKLYMKKISSNILLSTCKY